MFKKVLNHIKFLLIILISVFGFIFLAQTITELLTEASTFWNIVGVAMLIVFSYVVLIVGLPLLFFKFKEWLREKFKMGV